ncbi:uncharacterized protein TNCV_229481 [Trichonephila clavipes]|nr:uncharacterized protein TNCV_229481 [Trichonephila clavipes]
MSHLAFFAHANVFHNCGQPVPIELSIASIQEDGKDPEVICITVGHSNLLTTAKDSRANRYINERLSLKSRLPGSVPLEYLSFCVRGKFCHLAQGNRGLIVVKGSDQRKMFEKLGLFTINLEMLPHFRDLHDRTLPDHLHDEVHEDFDISECTMVKSYRFARYLQHFNKLQAVCKRQTAHLVEVENATEFLENIDNNLTYCEIPTQLACPYLKGHLTVRALDWFDVLGYRAVEEKATDYAHLKQALTEQFPVVRNRSELETRFYSS